MKQQFEQIRRLLDEVEACDASVGASDMPGFHALELPQVIQEIVDDLQPLLYPHLRLSGKALRKSVVKSSYSTAAENTISEGKVREIFRALEQLGALRKEGEANREGTPYCVLTPDEIPACRDYRSQRRRIELPQETAPSDIDYYNVRENRLTVFERDAYKCR